MKLRTPPSRLAALLIVIALVRMGSTFRVFSATTDEASHVAGGLEIYQHGRYTLQPMNPPLPRLLLALPPYLAGTRLDDATSDFFTELHSVFYNDRKYEDNLALARAGNLVIFAVAAAFLWLWASAQLGAAGGLVALVLFTMEPIVLGYSALATHDAAALAGFALAMFAFARWMEHPSSRRAVLTGAAYGVSVVCKYSCTVYVPLAAAAILAVRLVRRPETRSAVSEHAIRSAALAAASAAVVIWAAFGFTIGTVADLHAMRAFPGPFGMIARLDPRLPLPAPTFWNGLGGIVDMDREGFESYLFGEWRRRGWWWYFPAGVALKSTLALLALAVAGAFVTRRDDRLRQTWLECVAAAAAVLAAASRSHLDIGVRYVLPLYLPLCVAAAAATLALWQTRRKAARIAAAALVSFQFIVSVAAHPDYFPYFNALAGSDPSRALVDSNLDWEQDGLRLRKVVRELGIRRLAVRGVTSLDYEFLGFPPVDLIDDPAREAHGWVAVGDSFYRMHRDRGGWWWLRGKPFRRVGTSIRLFHVE
jgi:4-amino-4-deoxy-L-arabinose transferase-like glycosyltransferase